jgi:hypothetical protein
MGGICSTYGKRICAYRVLVGKPEGKRSLGRLRHRWEYLAVNLYIWQHISYMVHVVNQGAGKFSLTTHTNPFKAAATASRNNEIRLKNLTALCANLQNKYYLQTETFKLIF